jgi:hypothetical protein
MPGSSSANIRAGRAYIELGLNGDIEGGLKRAEARLRAFGAAVTGIGVKMAGLGIAARGVTRLFAYAA